jgi:hypothetical protein
MIKGKKRFAGDSSLDLHQANNNMFVITRQMDRTLLVCTSHSSHLLSPAHPFADNHTIDGQEPYTDSNDLLFLYKTYTSYVTVLTILTTRQMRQIFTSRPGTPS